MPKQVVIIGAVALGPKVACRLKRLDPEAEITLVDRDDLISYGGCGIPYYLGGDINDLEDLYSTSAHIRRDQYFFKHCKGVKVRTQVEATSINRAEKTITINDLNSTQEEQLQYDKLVLATGATPMRPPFPGSDLENVFLLKSLHEAEQIKTLMTKGKVGRAVVVGGGAIGLEICEAMTDLWGIETHLIEMEDQVLPTLLGKCIARAVKTHLEEKGVRVMVDDRVSRIFTDAKTGTTVVETAKTSIPTDIVILATGVRPNTELAKEAGLAIGNSGGILVDRRMRTSDPNIYAGGDCVELRNLISGENMLMALGSLANRQGRIIATNINGGSSHFDGTVGTFCIKVFDLGVAKAGLTFRQAKETGFDPVYAVISQADHAHFYPQSELLYISLIAERKTRKILGIEAAGKHGDAVKARVDAVAVLLKHGVTVDDICNMEAGYAPPYASAMDAVNNVGNTLDNILAGLNSPVDVYDFIEHFQRGTPKVLDTRATKEASPFINKYGSRWLNIPQDQLRHRLQEIPKDELLYLICDTGPRSYEAQVLLASVGITKTRNIQGGFAMVKMTDPHFI
ncbi:MAG: FAD-dependent oxidoreductase [Desulfocapsaceae bacterium]|nr:FAD-dependent oxidoreductase [Desulfocapsaceae bacterium]